MTQFQQEALSLIAHLTILNLPLLVAVKDHDVFNSSIEYDLVMDIHSEENYKQSLVILHASTLIQALCFSLLVMIGIALLIVK